MLSNEGKYQSGKISRYVNEILKKEEINHFQNGFIEVNIEHDEVPSNMG